MASLISAVLVLGGLGAATWGRLQDAFRPPGGAEPRGGSKGWLLRHPWWTLGLGLFVAHGLLWNNPSQHPLAAASVLLSEGSWFILTATWLAWRLAWGSLRLGWRMSRASSFLAGLVVAAGLFTATGWFVFFNFIEEMARSAGSALNQTVKQPLVGSGWSPSSLGARLPAGTQPAVPALFKREQHGALLLATTRFATLGEGDSFEGDYLHAAAADPSAVFATCVQGLNPQLRVEATSLASHYVDAVEAQDVVQDVLLRVCLSGRVPASFSSYFIASVKNRALEWRRRTERVCSIVEVPEPRCALQPDEDYLRAETSRAINKALCALSEEEQEVLRLRFYEGEDYADIAQRLSLSEVNARQRVSRALKKFRAAFLAKCL
jgi:RNA polymerase sigma factor (sigma-70 family)